MKTKLLLYSLSLFLICLCSKAQDDKTLDSQALQQIAKRLDGGERIERSDLNLQDLQFDINRSELSERTKKYLDNIAALMLRVDDLVLEVNGYSDPYTDEFEDRLSAERTEAVRDYLVEKGISADQIAINNLGNRFPVAESDTLDTSVNRRVELEFIKDEYIATQDIIVLKNGDEIRGEVTTANVKVVKYKDSRGRVKKFNTEEVQKVEFGDGKVLDLDEDSNKIDSEQTSDLDKLKALGDGIKLGKKIRLKSPDIFGTGVVIVQASWNPYSNLYYDLGEEDTPTSPPPNMPPPEPIERNNEHTEMFLPPLLATVEVGVLPFVGVGFSYGIEKWGIRPLEIEYTYEVYGARLAMHFNIAPQIDPYIGVGFNYRKVSLVNDPALCGPEWQNYRHEVVTNDFGIDPVVGLRWFINERWGFYGEFGSDGLGYLKLGTQFVLIRKARKKTK